MSCRVVTEGKWISYSNKYKVQCDECRKCRTHEASDVIVWNDVCRCKQRSRSMTFSDYAIIAFLRITPWRLTRLHDPQDRCSYQQGFSTGEGLIRDQSVNLDPFQAAPEGPPSPPLPTPSVAIRTFTDHPVNECAHASPFSSPADTDRPRREGIAPSLSSEGGNSLQFRRPIGRRNCSSITLSVSNA